MSGVDDVLVACENAGLPLGRGATPVTVAIHETDRLITQTDPQTRETPEASDARH